MLGCRSDRRQRCLRTLQDSKFKQNKTDEKEKEGKRQNRIFTEYSLFIDEKPINGSLERCLLINREADKNNVSKDMSERISEALRNAFLFSNPEYKEPYSQLELKFE